MGLETAFKGNWFIDLHLFSCNEAVEKLIFLSQFQEIQEMSVFRWKPLFFSTNDKQLDVFFMLCSYHLTDKKKCVTLPLLFQAIAEMNQF